MTTKLWTLVAAGGLLFTMLAPDMAFAQKQGGVLKVHHQDSPASMSIIEESTYSAVVPLDTLPQFEGQLGSVLVP